MRLISLVVLMLGFCFPVHADDWFVSTTGGSTIELPGFLEATRDLMENGISHGTEYDPTDGSSFWVQQYWLNSDQTPHQFIAERYSDGAATYEVDKPNFGVVSGYTVHNKPFYEICRRVTDRLECVEMGWLGADQDRVEPIISRIVKSFRH